MYMLFIHMSACSAIVRTQTDTRYENDRVLDSEVTYQVERHSLTESSLVMSLSRDCRGSREVDSNTYLVERTVYDTTWYWVGTALVGTGGIVGLVVNEGEDGVVITSALMTFSAMIASGVLTILEFVDPIIEETLVESRTDRTNDAAIPCTEPWPSGVGTLFSSSVAQEYPAHADGTGRIEVDLSDAPRLFWETTEPVHLDLYTLPHWVTFELDPEVRRVGLGRSSGAPVELVVSFDEVVGNEDGFIAPGEIGQLQYEITNYADTSIENAMLELSVLPDNPFDLVDAIHLASIPSGDRIVGEIEFRTLAMNELSAFSVEASLNVFGTEVRDQVAVYVSVPEQPIRAYTWGVSETGSDPTSASGMVRLETILTESGRYAFVSDTSTREHLDQIVDLGGGSLEERLTDAVVAANQENIAVVFRVEVLVLDEASTQVILRCYDTTNGDRVFQRDITIGQHQPRFVLAAIEQLARGYLEWEQSQSL